MVVWLSSTHGQVNWDLEQCDYATAAQPQPPIAIPTRLANYAALDKHYRNCVADFVVQMFRIVAKTRLSQGMQRRAGLRLRVTHVVDG